LKNKNVLLKNEKLLHTNQDA